MTRRALGLAALALGLSLRPAAGADDQYRFLPGGHAEHAAALEATPSGWRWAWPKPATRWETALAGVRVDARAEDPWVELLAGQGRVEQHLDPGAQGLRWLSLTSLRPSLAPGAVVEMRPHGLTIEPPVRVVLFTDRPPLERRILVLAPHPDDAEIAAFGLYAGRDATIVTVTSGNAGDANYQAQFPEAAQQYLFKGYLRALDSVTVPWQGGIPPERCFNLGYFDARLRDMHARRDEAVPEMYGPNTDVAAYRRANLGRLLGSGPRSNTWAHLVEDLAEVLRKVKPDVVVTVHPMLDSHLDHQYTTVALAEALERSKKRPAFLLYTNHASENLYPFGPAGTAMSLPPHAGPELAVEGVYSHPLGAELQRRKLFALESMHDLRLSPAEQTTCADPKAPHRPDYPRVASVDYFRRGPRSEETFLVASREGLRELVKTFLARREGGE